MQAEQTSDKEIGNVARGRRKSGESEGKSEAGRSGFDKSGQQRFYRTKGSSAQLLLYEVVDVR